MGLLDGIVGEVLKSSGAPPHPQNNDLVGLAVQMLGSSQGGGMAGVLRQFEQAGLSSLVASWVGTGANLPATPQHIEQGLGASGLAAITQKLGITPAMAAAQLAHLLPVLIDKLTPKGQVPPQSSLEQALSGMGGLGNLAGGLGSLLGGR